LERRHQRRRGCTGPWHHGILRIAAYLKIMGWLTTGVMLAAAIGLLITL
jgi:hypothetical protein